MTYRIFVEGPIHDHGRALLQAREDVTFSVHEKFTPEEMKVGLADADALILRQSPLSADVIEAAKKLRIVSRYGVGYDKVDVAALSARGIPLAVCGDALSASVAEHSLLLMLGISRNIAVMDRAT
jgi:D-3-phosphoglycerate dehydrogenase